MGEDTVIDIESLYSSSSESTTEETVAEVLTDIRENQRALVELHTLETGFMLFFTLALVCLYTYKFFRIFF